MSVIKTSTIIALACLLLSETIVTLYSIFSLFRITPRPHIKSHTHTHHYLVKTTKQHVSFLVLSLCNCSCFLFRCHFHFIKITKQLDLPTLACKFFLNSVLKTKKFLIQSTQKLIYDCIGNETNYNLERQGEKLLYLTISLISKTSFYISELRYVCRIDESIKKLEMRLTAQRRGVFTDAVNYTKKFWISMNYLINNSNYR